MTALRVVKDDSGCDARTAFETMRHVHYERAERGKPRMRDLAVDGSLVLFRGDSLLSKAIASISGSPYSHAGLVLRWGERVLLIEAAYPSVRVRPLSIAVADYHGIADLYVPRATLPAKTREALISIATAHLSVPFSIWDLGWLGLFGLIRRRFVEHHRPEDDLVCSEFVARVYGLAGETLVGTQVAACGNAKCLARSRPTLDGAAVAEESYASSVAPAQLLCSRRFEAIGRFSKEELGEVKAAREKLVEDYVKEHRVKARAQHGTPIK